MRAQHRRLPVLIACAALWLASPAAAQLNGLDLSASGGPALSSSGDVVSVSAKVTPNPDGKSVRLAITAEIKEGWHIYARGESKDYIPSKIKLDPSPQFQLSGDFTANPQAVPHNRPGLTAPSLEHAGKVTWTVTLVPAAGVDPAKLQPTGSVKVQACSEATCLVPKDLPFTAEYTVSTGVYQPEKARVTLRGEVSKAIVAAGQTVELQITAEPDAGYWVYAWQPTVPKEKNALPVLLTVTPPAGWTASAPRPSVEPEVKQVELPGSPPSTKYLHPAPVTWTMELTVPSDAQPGVFDLTGYVGYQTCNKAACLPPKGAEYQAQIQVAASTPAQASAAPLAFTEASYVQIAKLAAQQATSQDFAGGVRQEAPMSAGLALVLAFAAGFVLNFMPCVLPVIGLKILAFVEQAGESRSRVFMLNLWYTFGMLSVFLGLATLAVLFNQAWGAQFQSAGFNVTMAAVVFVFALSFLGVWEIPIPGFVGNSAAQQVAEKEGPTGAFLKGVLTTVLATPCTGPMLGPALAWGLSQPPVVTYIVFACVGLGMAFPYLVIGAYPRLIALLPKPGAWMETFKQLMGFVLLFTVVFLLSFTPQKFIIPTLTFLFALWAACWWIGRTPAWESLDKRLSAWIGAAGFAAVLGWFSFGFLMQPPSHPLPWQDFSRDKFNTLIASEKTVLVDFTADWCLVCKANEALALNTADTKRLVENYGVVTLKADKTEEAPEIDNFLAELGQKSGAIPFLAIFPASNPREPILMSGPVTQATVLEAIEKAGASRESGKAPVTNASLRTVSR